MKKQIYYSRQMGAYKFYSKESFKNLLKYTCVVYYPTQDVKKRIYQSHLTDEYVVATTFINITANPEFRDCLVVDKYVNFDEALRNFTSWGF